MLSYFEGLRSSDVATNYSDYYGSIILDQNIHFAITKLLAPMNVPSLAGSLAKFLCPTFTRGNLNTCGIDL